MDETKVRVLLREWADGAPEPDPTIPRSVLGRSRRRVARNAGGAALAVAVIAFAAVTGIRAFGGSETRRPATPNPIVLPSGAWVTLLSSTHIYLAKPDGSETIRVAPIPPRLAANGFIPLDWSPDGNRLLFRVLADDTIALMNADGTRLAYLAGGVDASWSKDGGRVLVVSPTEAEVGASAVQRGEAIYLSNPDGSEFTALSRGSNASFSPDGNLVLVVSPSIYDHDPQPMKSIHVVRVGSGDPDGVRLDPDGGAFSGGSATWSPDGTRIVFASCALGKGCRIYVVRPDGTGLRFLTAGSDPSWSPDGSKITFTMEKRGGADDIYVMGADGSGLLQLTTDPGPDTKPSWSPDGSKIAFFAARGDRQGIYVMNPDGTDQHFLGTFPSTVPRIVWRVTGG